MQARGACPTNNMKHAFPLAIVHGVEHAQHDGMTLLDYFAAHEPTMPPPAFYQSHFPPNPLKAKDGSPMPTSDPSPEELAGAIAKWRFVMADAMLKESQKRA